MPIAARIRKQGFQRWYERQLIEAHASLVTAFLCVIVVAVCVDQFRWREGGFKPLMIMALVVAGVLICIKAVGVYFRVLFRAEHVAQQVNCRQCAALWRHIGVDAFGRSGGRQVATSAVPQVRSRVDGVHYPASEGIDYATILALHSPNPIAANPSRLPRASRVISSPSITQRRTSPEASTMSLVPSKESSAMLP